MFKVVVDGPKVLLFGYAAFAAFFVIFPFVVGQSDIIEQRVGSADSFTVLITHSILILSFWTVFFNRSVDVVVTPDAVRALVVGIMVESVGWIVLRGYWTPWYVYKEVSKSIPELEYVYKSLSENVEFLTPAYVLVWVGCGLTMNVVFRTTMREHFRYWPFVWLAVIMSSWIIGYSLPDLALWIHS